MVKSRKKEPNATDAYVGQRIRARRMMLGMSQERLGNALGLTFQQVQKYEKGTNRVGASRLQQTACALEVPPSYFFDGAPAAPNSKLKMMAAPPEASILANKFFAAHGGAALARAFLAVNDPKLRHEIVHFAATLAEATGRLARRAG